MPILVWIGVRSYGIYLWHWPIFMVTRPHADVPITGIPLLVFRIALTFVFAALSYKYVEEPFRSGAVGRRFAEWREARGERKRQLGTTFAIVGGVMVAAVLVIAAGFAGAEPTPRPPGLPAVSATVIAPTTTATPAHTAPAGTTPAGGAASATTTTAPHGGAGTAPAAASPGTSAPATALAAAVAAAASAVPGPAKVTAVGDSVMLGAAAQLADTIGADRTTVDAVQNRQFSAGVDTIQQYADSGQLGSEVVVQLGTNGTINPDDFDRMMGVLKNANKVLVVNAKVPRPWEDEVNQVLGDGVKKYSNAKLIDWHDIAAAHPEFFWDDGIHLRPEGAQFYAQLIASNL
jgi:hypothetical protein